MLLSDVEALLNITIPTDTKTQAVYNARLEAAISQVQTYCNQTFINIDSVLDMPGSVKMGVALIVQAMGDKQNVSSQSLGDMSKSFFQNGTFEAATVYLKPFRKAGFK